MSNLLSIDSPLVRFLTKLADLMLLNLVFIVTSLPLVTLGASLTALSHTAMRIVTDDYESVSATYLRSFRSNLKAGSLLGLIGLGLLAVAGAWYVVIDNLRVSTTVKAALFVVFFLALYRLLGTLLFVFPYQATFANTVPEVLNNARKMSARHPIACLTVLLVSVPAILVTVFVPAAVGWGLVWLAVGFAGIAFLTGIVFVGVFRRYGLNA